MWQTAVLPAVSSMESPMQKDAFGHRVDGDGDRENDFKGTEN